MNIHKSSYYAWRKTPLSNKINEDKAILIHMKKIFEDSLETYGILRIQNELKKVGYSCSKDRISRLMRENNIVVKCRKKFKAKTNSNHNYPVAPNLLSRDFETDAPNKVWVGDITYISTSEGWLYLATVLDIYSKKVVGWSLSNRMTKELCITALDQAIGTCRPEPGLMFHSDRGTQYASYGYQEVLLENGIIQSMSRKGNCWDNACAESFFSTLKSELVHRNKYMTREGAKLDIVSYIETFYNSKRIHSSLGYKSPNEFLREFYNNQEEKLA